MLSDNEFELLKTELLPGLKGLLAKHGAESKRGDLQKLGAFLNAPLSIAIASGLGIWFMTFHFQEEAAKARTELQARWAEAEKQRERDKQLLDRRLDLIVQFANSIPRLILSIDRFKKRELWLRENIGTSKAIYADQRDFKETRDYYDKLVDEYMKGSTPTAMRSQVLALFQSIDVREKMEKLEAVLDFMVLAKSIEEVKDRVEDAQTLASDLVDIMIAQITP